MSTIEAAMIRVTRQRLWHRDGEPEELATTMEALEDEDDPKILTMTTEESGEEAENTTRPSEHL